MSSLVTGRERSVFGKITRSGFDTRNSRPPASTTATSERDIVLLERLQLAPAAPAVVGDDLLEHRGQGAGVDAVALTERDGPGCLVLVAGRDDAFGVGREPPVVEKQVDVILCGEQRAHV